MVKMIETGHQHCETPKDGAGGGRDEGNRMKVMPPSTTYVDTCFLVDDPARNCTRRPQSSHELRVKLVVPK